jgi:acetyl-CoA carboxylase carboxyltransferase component
MGASGRAILAQDPTEYQRLRESPWVSALLGQCYGSSTWYAAMSDFVVMRKGSVMAIASPGVTSIAIGKPIDPEELGGWKLLTGVSGLADMAVDTDEQALDAVKRFLSYMPAHSVEPPPECPVPAGSGDACRKMLEIVRRRATRSTTCAR